MNSHVAWGFPALIFAAAFLVSTPFWLGSYTGLSRGKAFVALLASALPGVVYFLRMGNMKHVPSAMRDDVMAKGVAAGLCFVFLTALALRLWGRWIGDSATPEERQPGKAGVRAWFCTANVVVGIAITLLAWIGFDISPLLSALVIGALLAAYPVAGMETPTATAEPLGDHLSAEREKIVSMLEAGKLTPDESAELLQALGETSRSHAVRAIPLTGGQRLMLIGAALVGLGFFLPWLVVNPGKEAGRMMNKMQSSMSSSFNGTVSFPGGMNFPGMEMKTSSISISGGDIPRGLGWAALLFALTAAFLPYVATTLDAATARTVRLLSLGLGGVIVLYLLTQNLRFVGIGLVLAVSGYVLEAVGVFRERRTAAVSRTA